MTTADLTGNLHDIASRYPMGPALRKFLGLGDSQPEMPVGAGDEDETRRMFTGWFRSHLQKSPPLPADVASDLLDELVAMANPESAFDLVAQVPELAESGEFRVQLALGVAAMLLGDGARAMTYLRRAQSILPREPAPYVNMTEILLAGGELDEARVWCEAGLDAEPNNIRLWEQAARILVGERHPDPASELIRMSGQRNAWAGVSLGHAIRGETDPAEKVLELTRMYDSGERDPDFLVEYTATLGVAGMIRQIPQIIWQAEKDSSRTLPWQLWFHSAQANLALGMTAACESDIAKVLADPATPDNAREAALELQREAREPAPEAPVRH